MTDIEYARLKLLEKLDTLAISDVLREQIILIINEELKSYDSVSSYVKTLRKEK